MNIRDSLLARLLMVVCAIYLLISTMQFGAGTPVNKSVVIALAGARLAKSQDLTALTNPYGSRSVLLDHSLIVPRAPGPLSRFFPKSTSLLPVDWRLISHWKGEGDAQDSVGTNHGSLHNVGFVPGTSGQGFSFVNGYVSVPSSSTLQPQRIKVEAWVKHQGTPGRTRYLLSQGADKCTAASYGLYTGNNGGLRFYISNGTSFFESGDAGAGVWNGNWRHVVGLYDGTSVRLVVDDVDLGGIAVNTNIAYNLPTDSKFYIGTYGGDTNPCSGIAVNYTGDIDEISVWSGDSTECSFPSIAAQPLSRRIPRDTSTTIFVQANGEGVFTYQWYIGHKGNTSNPTGSNSPNLTVELLHRTTTYWVRVTNGCGKSVDSEEATVTVTCSCQGVPTWYQAPSVTEGGPTWADDHYDHDPDAQAHISTWGCTLTTLAMALRQAGVNSIDIGTSLPRIPHVVDLDPGSLNVFMVQHQGNYVATQVVLPTTAKDVFASTANSALRWHELSFEWSISDATAFKAAATIIDDQLCLNHPVIVRVQHLDSTKGLVRHYVLIVGRDGDRYRVIDPGRRAIEYLDDARYMNYPYELRGYVSSTNDPINSTGNFRELDTLSIDQSGVTFSVNDNADLLVIDPQGRRTGFDKTTGQIINEIPQATYHRDSLGNDETDVGSNGTAHFITISQPTSGSYTVVVYGLSLGEYQVLVRPFLQNGQPEFVPSFTDSIAPGSSKTYQLPLFLSSNSGISILKEENSAHAIAMDSVTLLRDPFPLSTDLNFSLDRRTRVSLFVTGINLFEGESPTDLTAQLQDSSGNTYPVPVEYVGKVRGLDWLSQVTIKLPVGNIRSGQAVVTLTLHGVTSNPVAIEIK